MEDEQYYPASVDHSQDVTIHHTKDGEIFAIKNIRQEVEGDTLTFKADISGDEESANKYLKSLVDRIIGMDYPQPKHTL